ncbi:MAG: hypothetical protein RMK89_05855 [Armatimonadota bacterium]|nr:hypothetical protein [Armatimonadota bacterium]MDW8142972.1 hypothetical protein [Armatimonadota bacterium]
MKALRNLPLEKKNALLILVIVLLGFLVALLTLRPQTSPVTKLWERMHGDKPAQWHEIAFSHDGEHVITAAQTVKIWRTKDGQLVRSFPLAVKNAVKTISSDGRWIATYESNGAVKLWKLPEGKVIRTMKGEKGNSLFLAFSPNGRFLAAASYDLGVVKVWRTENGNLMHSLSLGVNRILGLAISPNGKLLATMTDHFNPKTKQQDMHLVLWNLPNGKKVFSRKTPVIPTRCYYLLPPLTSIWVDRNVFSFSPKGSFLAVAGVGSKGYTVAIFKAESGKVDREIVLQNRFMAISFHPQNESLIFVHEEFSRDILDPLRPASLNVPALWFFSDTLTCWHLKETGLKEFWKTKELVTHSLHSWIDPTSAFAFSPDGKLIAIVTLGSKVKLFRIEGD